jgi:hypothetical protein
MENLWIFLGMGMIHESIQNDPSCVKLKKSPSFFLIFHFFSFFGIIQIIFFPIPNLYKTPVIFDIGISYEKKNNDMVSGK